MMKKNWVLGATGLLLAFAGSAAAQSMVSTVNISLTACDEGGIRVRVTNKDIITALTGGAPNGKRLVLVTPAEGNRLAIGGDNLGASLRVVQGREMLAETTSDTFNIYQDSATSGRGSATCAINRFSLDFGADLQAELQGFSTWKARNGGLGALKSTVNGTGTIRGNAGLPLTGNISAGAPRPDPQTETPEPETPEPETPQPEAPPA